MYSLIIFNKKTKELYEIEIKDFKEFVDYMKRMNYNDDIVIKFKKKNQLKLDEIEKEYKNLYEYCTILETSLCNLFSTVNYLAGEKEHIPELLYKRIKHIYEIERKHKNEK